MLNKESIRITILLKWVNKVHEVLEGYKTKTNLPLEEEWSFLHDKEIERQEKQNAYYETL